MLKLKLPTDPRWVNIVERNIEEILTDHAFCEQKAASNAISIVVKHPEKTEMVTALLALAKEELTHFEMVHQKLVERGFVLGKERKDEYVNLLYNFMRRGGSRVTQLIDRLLFAAMIEARSCERFRVLSENIKDADLAERFIKQLSNVYRYVLESRDKEVVPLSEEIEQLEAYIFLMKIRFGESLKVNINAPDLDGHIAPLTLQMLVENALKHNEVSRSHPLSIDVFLAENAWIVVKNSIKSRNSVGESTGVGLENIRSRYKFLSQKEVVISQNDGFFTVKIPII